MNKQIFDEIQTLKRQILPNERLILFGSQARGDARPDSDWDLLLLLKNSMNKEEYEDKTYEFVKMGWNYGTYFSIKIFTEYDWKKGKIFPFYQNVMRDGIEIK
jgi:predicted nucleotidyltransferase